jgi:RND family efflux transporter MFP subunit
MKKKLIIGTILIVGLFAYMITNRIISKANLTKTKVVDLAISVNTASSSTGKIDGIMNYTGTVEGINEAVVISQTAGVATKVNLSVGQRVSEGTVLATVENSQQSAGLEQAKAQVLAAESNYEKAQLDLGRVEKLYKDNVATKDNLELSNLNVKSALAQLRSAQAMLKVSEKQHADTYIKATISGFIATKDIDRGGTIAPGMRITKIVDNSKYKVKIMVNENDAAKLEEGKKVTLKIDALPDRNFEGKVSTIGMSSESGMRSYPVEIIIDGKAGKELKSGMFARCEIHSESRPDAILIPEKAVIMNNDGTFSVYVIDNGKATLKQIKLGVKNNGVFEVLSGLEANVKVATEGKERLVEGISVKENKQ